MQIYKAEGAEHLVGFCGQFEWQNTTVVSLDGDTYADDMLVYGYEWWENEPEGISCGLDILVDID